MCLQRYISPNQHGRSDSLHSTSLLTSFAKLAQLLRLDLQGQHLGTHSTSREVTDQEEKVGNPTLSTDSTNLALFIEAPDRVELVGVLRTDSLSNGVREPSVPRGKDDDIKVFLGSVLEGDLGRILAKASDLSLLDFDISLDNHLGSTRGKVVSTGLFQSHCEIATRWEVSVEARLFSLPRSALTHQEPRSLGTSPSLESGLFQPTQQLAIRFGELGDESLVIELGDEFRVGLRDPIGEIGRWGVFSVKSTDCGARMSQLETPSNEVLDRNSELTQHGHSFGHGHDVGR